MKKQSTKYILLALVIIIWSLIIGRFFSLRSDNEVYTQMTSASTLKSEKAIDNTFVLALDYPDPFLRDKEVNQVNSRREEVPVGITEKTKISKDSLSVKLPSVTYNGMITNMTTGRKVGLFVCERKEYMLRVGDSVAGACILTLSNDSVRIAFENQIFNIRKGQK